MYKKLGILGGGQLGRMLIQAGIDLDVYIKVLDPDAEAPCKALAHEFVQGKLTDYNTVVSFAQDCDTVTIEIENVCIEALEELERQGKKVYPQPSVLRKIKDKRLQKQFFKAEGIPTARFALVENRMQLNTLNWAMPYVNKVGEGGYDGRGVQVVRSHADLEKAFDEPSIVEELIDFEKEIAVLVARTAVGELRSFSAVEMVFHPEANLVEYLFAPARLSETEQQAAKALAEKTATTFNIVGLLAVEMFLTKSGEILVNEVAPRPHNSGHHTMRANAVSQFEQHLRAILGFPLGDTSAYGIAAMVNLLGEPGYEGEAIYEGLAECLGIPGVYPFLYGKKMTKPFRKMGHVSIVDANFDKLKEKVIFVKQTLKVKAKYKMND